MTVKTIYDNYYNIIRIEPLDKDVLIMFFDDGDSQAIFICDLIQIEETND